MSKDYATQFYNSRAWIKCRDGFMGSKGYICERCGGLAYICHHIIHITPANIHDPNITLSWDNLMALCVEDHNNIHGSTSTAEGLMFDSRGNLVEK